MTDKLVDFENYSRWGSFFKGIFPTVGAILRRAYIPTLLAIIALFVLYLTVLKGKLRGIRYTETIVYNVLPRIKDKAGLEEAKEWSNFLYLYTSPRIKNIRSIHFYYNVTKEDYSIIISCHYNDKSNSASANRQADQILKEAMKKLPDYLFFEKINSVTITSKSLFILFLFIALIGFYIILLVAITYLIPNLFRDVDKLKNFGAEIIGFISKRKKKQQFQYTKIDALEYTVLFDNLLLRDAKLILVTSAHASEGKTITAIKLVRTIVSAGKKAIVVDTDLYRSGLSNLLDTDNKGALGLTDYLDETKPIEDFISPNRGIDYIMIGSVQKSAGLVLKNKKFKDLIAVLKERYDFVILDSAPLWFRPDAYYLSEMCDYTVFIAALDKSNFKAVKSSYLKLKTYSKNIGFLITNIGRGNDSYTRMFGYFSDR